MINVYSHEYGLLSSKFNNENIMNFMFFDSDKSIRGQTKKGDKITIGYSEVDKKYKVNNSEGTSVPNDKNATVYNTITI